jgi:tetratricopeptide (TPR) repeat protein
MQRVANTARFLIDLSFQQRFADSESVVTLDGALHDFVLSRLAHSANSHQISTDLASGFIRLAEHVYSTRDMKKLEEASRVLMNLPLVGARQIGLFYRALTLKRAGQLDEAQGLFETIADNGPLAYRARAIQALGALHYDKGQPAEALRFHLEAARAASDVIDQNLLVTLMVQLEISHIQAHVGNHQGALSNLEKLAALVRLVAKQHPFYLYFYHNALAVEFEQSGRIEEAEAACEIALASPFASAYPEWTETREEIAAKRISATPSIVAINRGLDPLLAEPQRRQEPIARLAVSRPARKRTFLQRASHPIADTAAIPQDRITQSILDRVLTCIGALAPPELP